MLLGTIIMLTGIVLLIANKEIAIVTGAVQRGYFNQFGSSAARQNIAIIGLLLSLAGFGAFLFL